MIGRLALITCCVVWAAPGLASKPQIQWNQEYDFESVETFQWSVPPQASLEASDPWLHEHVVNTIQYHLTGSGLLEVASDPDVLVTYHMSIETDVRLQSTSVGYSFGGYGRSGWGHYGYGIGGPVYTNTRATEVERGALVLDIWDAASNELIWRGQVGGITISGDPGKTRKNIEKAIARMAKQAEKLHARARR